MAELKHTDTDTPVPAAEPAPQAAPDKPSAAQDEPAGGNSPNASPSPVPIEATAGQNLEMPDLQQVLAGAAANGIDLLSDVELNVSIELGRTRMFVEDVLRLSEGSVVELDKLAGDPVDVYVNERLVARGEVLVLNDNFCVRVNEVLIDMQPGPDGNAGQSGQETGKT